MTEAKTPTPCGCSCGCSAPGQRDDDGAPGWCDSCRMNIHAPADTEVSGHVEDWTPEQVRLVTIYGTCQTCGAPRTSVTVERSPSNWHASMACLNGHGEGDC